jgi:serine/threonine-protein kinase HipA
MVLNHCPGTLVEGYTTYSSTCRRRMFLGRKVSHLLPFDSPNSNESGDQLFIENTNRISISGVQEKFSVLLEKNNLRLTGEEEQGSYILKPIPRFGKNLDQMPANEHLTMQIASQVFKIETAENALIFFKNGAPAYLTKRYDVQPDGSKWATEDFASLAGRSPQSHGAEYKYLGNYLDLFELLKKYISTYQIEASKLFKLLVFNYLFSNGDAHLKNFSLLETPLGDFRLSPAYDLLNTRLHIDDSEFALTEGLLPKKMSGGKISVLFQKLATQANLSDSQYEKGMSDMISKSDEVEALIGRSYLNDRMKRSYLQYYQQRLNKLL